MSDGFVKITPQISPKLAALLKNHEARVSDGITSILNTYGAKMEREIKTSLSIGGYGKTRKALRKGGRAKLRDYTPSEPGQPPHLRTGALRASIGFKVISNLGEKISLLIGSIRSGSATDRQTGKSQTFNEGVKYSKYLENPLDRPYLTPVVEEGKNEITRTIRTWTKKLFKGEQ